ncbi:hypothetical protein E1265_32250 [Streptomyces sp. 8K308]|uniref:hypothetical protein n=1 Tax=Streptomyces sp. 8K308 TaxID=2530388 RepID=UPI00105332FB|nr:hypothetical protein [Streptomyces sp. 8K308]TDC09414.1 hypothetical protein E1265_32250 [Streptomyces sp. 8K308]
MSNENYSPRSSDEFDDIIAGNYTDEAVNSPYGGPARKPGMTRRGKLILGGAAVAGVTVLGIGGFVAVNSMQQNAIREREIELQLRLAEMEHEQEMQAARLELGDVDPSELCVETEDGQQYEAVASCSPSDITAAVETATAAASGEGGGGGGSAAVPASAVVLVVICGVVYLATKKRTA